jgi:hypothetical protein
VRDGQSALMMACAAGAVGAVEQLVEANAQLEATCDRGWQAIHYACAALSVPGSDGEAAAKPQLAAPESVRWRALRCLLAHGAELTDVVGDAELSVRNAEVVRVAQADAQGGAQTTGTMSDLI